MKLVNFVTTTARRSCSHHAICLFLEISVGVAHTDGCVFPTSGCCVFVVQVSVCETVPLNHVSAHPRSCTILAPASRRCPGLWMKQEAGGPKRINKDGTIAQQSFEEVSNKTGFRPGMMSLRRLVLSLFGRHSHPRQKSVQRAQNVIFGVSCRSVEWRLLRG